MLRSVLDQGSSLTCKRACRQFNGFLFCDRIAPGFDMKPVLFREKKLRPSPFMVSRFSVFKPISLVSYLVKSLKSIYAVYPCVTFVQDIN